MRHCWNAWKAPTLSALFVLLLGACGDEKGKTPPPPACDEGLERCGEGCVDLLSNTAHCGGCGTACGEGERCADGRCQAACPGELRLCDGVCTDLAKAPAHCGACGNACGPDEVCSEGSCLVQCTGSLVSCGGSCVDPGSDDEHCGACDAPCGPEQRCAGGTCVCDEGLRACGGACVDVDEDPAHCGACNFNCLDKDRVSSATCDDKLCVFTCEEGYADCDGIDLNGCEAKLGSLDHCGACNDACVGGQVCEDGQCLCGGDFTECPFGCYNLQTDMNNCGTCGLECSSRPGVALALGCTDGDCNFICQTGRDNCDGRSENGCEAFLDTDSAHCGACNSPCPAGYHCEEGACTKDCPAGQRGCGDVCVNHQTDVRNCGTCGLDCAAQPGVASATCGGGICQPVCLVDWVNCDGNPANGCEANIKEDSKHCGGCNVFCKGSCVDGVCDAKGEIDTAWKHTCAVGSDGAVHCWGQNQASQLGNGNTTASNLPVPVQASPGTQLDQVLQVAVGGYQSTTSAPDTSFSCALMMDHTVRCWGDNSFGQLGTGDLNARTTPTRVTGLSNVRELRAGGEHACALLQDGTMYCWGNGNAGRLGAGDELGRSVPTQVMEKAGTTLQNVQGISVGRTYSCALLQGGTARCWGSNANSQLGIGTTTKALFPTTVVGTNGSGALTNIVAIASGGLTSCAILQDGSAACWGYIGSFGSLGDGSTKTSAIPIPVRENGGALLKGITQTTHGSNHMCLLLEDTSARCVGWNWRGRLGIASDLAKGPDYFTPVVSAADTKKPLLGIIQISAGESHTCLQMQNGDVLCAGDNGSGQLGDGGTSDRTSFVPTQL